MAVSSSAVTIYSMHLPINLSTGLIWSSRSHYTVLYLIRKQVISGQLVLLNSWQIYPQGQADPDKWSSNVLYTTYVGYSGSKYRLRISLVHRPDCPFTHVQW